MVTEDRSVVILILIALFLDHTSPETPHLVFLGSQEEGDKGHLPNTVQVLGELFPSACLEDA